MRVIVSLDLFLQFVGLTVRVHVVVSRPFLVAVLLILPALGVRSVQLVLDVLSKLTHVAAHPFQTSNYLLLLNLKCLLCHSLPHPHRLLCL